MTDLLPGPAAGASAPEARPRRRRSPWGRFWRQPMAAAAAVVLAVLVICSFAAPLLARYDPIAQDIGSRLLPPGGEHLLGTDTFGRDQLSRLLYGGRTSLTAALQAVVIGAGLGVPLGMLAGFFRGWAERVLGWVMEVLMSIPGIILALTVVAVLGRNIVIAMTAVGVILMPRFYRVARAATLDIRAETFVDASLTIGCSPARVLGRHIAPNILPVLVVQVSIMLGIAVTIEAGLSFLGLGVQPPDPSWGSMLDAAFEDILVAPYLTYAPGVLITLTVLTLTLVGDGIRSAVGVSRAGGEGRS